MSIELPSAPGIQTGRPSLLDFGGMLIPPGGGIAQQLIRPGRFSLDVTLPSARSTAEGRIFISRLIRAKSQGGLIGFPQDLDVGDPGDEIKVAVAGQTGSTLDLTGFPPGYTVLEGQFFSMIFAGRRYLHEADADTAADGNGQMELPISPMLRVSPNQGAVCEFARPMIEGYIAGNAVQWKIQTAPFIDITFTISEMA